jgi:hypothetical protein
MLEHVIVNKGTYKEHSFPFVYQSIHKGLRTCFEMLRIIEYHCPFYRNSQLHSSLIDNALSYLFRSRVSSVSIVSDYGLDDRAIGVRSPAQAKDFSSSLCVQTGSGVHPASCTMGTRGPFPGGKGAALVPRSRMNRSYTPLPPSASMACSGTALPFFYLTYSAFNSYSQIKLI